MVVRRIVNARWDGRSEELRLRTGCGSRCLAYSELLLCHHSQHNFPYIALLSHLIMQGQRLFLFFPQGSEAVQMEDVM